jgi:hypothetical protein
MMMSEQKLPLHLESGEIERRAPESPTPLSRGAQRLADIRGLREAVADCCDNVRKLDEAHIAARKRNQN